MNILGNNTEASRDSSSRMSVASFDISESDSDSDIEMMDVAPEQIMFKERPDEVDYEINANHVLPVYASGSDASLTADTADINNDGDINDDYDDNNDGDDTFVASPAVFAAADHFTASANSFANTSTATANRNVAPAADVIDLTLESDEEQPAASTNNINNNSQRQDEYSDDDIVVIGENIVEPHAIFNQPVPVPGMPRITTQNNSIPSGVYIPPPQPVNFQSQLMNVLETLTRRLIATDLNIKRYIKQRDEAALNMSSADKRIAELLPVTGNRAATSEEIVKKTKYKKEKSAANARIEELKKLATGIQKSISFVKANPQTIFNQIKERATQLNDIQPTPPIAGSASNPYAVRALKSESVENRISHENRLYTRAPSNDVEEISRLIANIKPDDDNIEDDKLVQTPHQLNITLLKHQRLGLEWLLKMERDSSCKGGILADDMGLGKTVQAMSIILANPGPPERKTTLIIGPVALLRQWRTEIETKIKPEYKLSTFMYHASEKVKKFEQLAEYDVVLTSYGTLASEFKKHFREYFEKFKEDHVPFTQADYRLGGRSYCSPFYEKDAIFHRIILDEAHYIKNKKAISSKACRMLRAVYRLCLSGTPLQNNVEELFPLVSFLKIKPYCEEREFRRYIVLPLKGKSYEQSDVNRAMRKLQVLLKAILLRREKSHKIDGKSILNLPPKVVEREDVAMEGDEKEFYNNLAEKTANEANKLLKNEQIGNYSSILTLLLRLRQACCHSFLVRIGDLLSQATKSDNEEIIDLLPNILDDDNVAEGKDEKKESEAIRRMITNSRQFDQATINLISEPMKSGDTTCQICYDGLNSSNTMLLYPCGHAICQECIVPFFENNSADDPGKASCTVCQKPVSKLDMVHYEVFLQTCILKNRESEILDHFGISEDGDTEESVADDFGNESSQIMDSESLTLMQQFYPNLNSYSKLTTKQKILKSLLNAQQNKFFLSPKMERCLELIQRINKVAPDEKIIVFSQFTVFFDLLGQVLRKNKIGFLRYDGSMSAEDRDNCIKSFYSENQKVILISLRAGSVGLTLTCANHVIIIDPFWNPYVEEQAMDRAYRIGQMRKVNVYRLLISGTVEDRIMNLQEDKRKLVEGALNQQEFKKISRLGVAELRYLLGVSDARPEIQSTG